MSMPRVLPALMLALAVAGCAAPAPVRTMMPVPSSTKPFTETGRASWYGEPHHGRHTANGERFDMHALTAAHPSLPFGTRRRVVTLDTDREVEVRVNDRGPSISGRILDLSYAAARALQAVEAGIIRVRFTVLPAE
jgi:rare lipoprotein A